MIKCGIQITFDPCDEIDVLIFAFLLRKFFEQNDDVSCSEPLFIKCLGNHTLPIKPELVNQTCA
jgi:hypothetical protein